jgi:hypothetical protein
MGVIENGINMKVVSIKAYKRIKKYLMSIEIDKR